MASSNLIMHYEDGHTERAVHATYNQSQQIARTREVQFPVGTRVRLIALAQNENGYDDRPNLPPGSIGVVSGTPDAMGSLPIKWDHGSGLSATADDVIERA